MKVLVNIYNQGVFMGMKLPAYNVSIDQGVYEFMREIGFAIEIAKPQAQKEPQAAPVAKAPDPKPVEQPKPVVHETVKVVETPVVASQPVKAEAPVEEWLTHDTYTEIQLESLSMKQLIQILAYRGHKSSRFGSRDTLAPKYVDRKKDLIDKVMKTNKVI